MRLLGGSSEVLFPWTIAFDNNLSVRVASSVPRDRLLWATAVIKISGSPLRGDDSDFYNPSQARRLGTDFDSNDMGLALNVGSMASHAAKVCVLLCIHNVRLITRKGAYGPPQTSDSTSYWQVYIDGSHFAGGVVNNVWEGVGRLRLSTGDIYEGHFVNGNRHGRGLMRYATGNIYNGQFVHGHRHGEGSYYELRGLGTSRWPVDMELNDTNTTRRIEKAEALSETHLQLAWHFPKACAVVCCSVLQCVAVCCSALQCVAVQCSVFQCVTVCCSVLQCVAVCCSVVQCGTVCCSVCRAVQYTYCKSLMLHHCTVWHSAWQYVVACCSVLQCVAVC